MKKFSNFCTENGYTVGKADGLEEGRVIGFEKGILIGLEKGKDEGFDSLVKKSKEGELIGFKEGMVKGFIEGIDNGFKAGIDNGIDGLDNEFKERLLDGYRVDNEHVRIKIKIEEQERISALKMIKKGITIEDIHEFTGLSIEEIAELKKTIKNGEL